MLTRKRKVKSPRAQVTDTRHHALTVFDGAVRCGSLVERAGKFDAYTADGRHLGTFSDLRAAARVIPPTAPSSRQGKRVHTARLRRIARVACV